MRNIKSASSHWATFIVALLIAWTPLMSRQAMGQTSVGTSSVAGVVRDSTGAAIGRAHITLLDRHHGTTRNTIANSQGEYVFLGVLPGLYAVRIDQQGFQTTTVDNVQVVIDQSATVNPVLAVGNVSQTVEVNSEGATPLLDTSSNAIGEVINNTLVEQLPLNGRNFLQLAQLSGGVVPSTTSNQTGHDALTLEVAGTSQWDVGYNIDGISTRSPRIGNSSLNLSVAAIDQFKIELGFFLPDKGPQAAIIDVATKAGTNTVHGEVYEFFRNRDLNAYQYSFGAVPPIKDDLHRNQFGFAIGGPIVIPKLFNGRDKLFFFGNYEGLRQTDKNQSRVTTPTLAMFGGDFKDTGVTIYNPYSYNATTGLRDPFDDDAIPSTMIAPIATALLAYYIPGSTYPLPKGVSGNLTRFPASTLRDDQFTIRVDSTLSQRQQLYVNFSYQNSPAVTASIFPLAGSTFPLKAALGVVQHTMTLGPHILNIFRLGYDRAYVFQAGEGEDGPLTQRLIGINGTLDGHGIPAIGMTGFTGFGKAYSRVGEISNSYQLAEAFNYTRGSHNMAFGAGVIYHRTLQQNSNAGARGSLAFQDIYTSQKVGGAGGGGSAFADFLLGLPLSGSVAGFQGIHYRFTEYYPYFQDSWRVSPTFTVNYGTAWYYSTVPNPQGPDALLEHAFNFQTGLLEYSALGQISPKILNPDYNNWAPRLGFVWAPTSIPNTTVRAGFGAYYGQWGLNDIQGGTYAPPFSDSLPFTNNKTANLPAITFNGGIFPQLEQTPLTASYAANIPPGTSPDIIDPNSRTPYYLQWNLAVQHTFGRNDLLEADYIGNVGHKGTNRYQADQCPYEPSLYCDNSLIPYPQYASIFYINYSTNNNYNGMILKYQHHFSHGLTMLANYTYQKSLTDGFEPNGPYGANEQNSGCRPCDYGLTSYSIPHSVVVSAVYKLPFGRGRHFGSQWSAPLNAMVGGWSMSVIGTMQHGTASYVISPNQTQSKANEQRADQLCNGNNRDISRHLRTNGYTYFDTSCYATPASGYFGTSGRAPLWTPGVDSWTMGAVKSFPIYDRMKFELRGEAFNVFNHANFGNPDVNTGDIVSGKFGTISSVAQPRLVQLAGKLVW